MSYKLGRLATVSALALGSVSVSAPAAMAAQTTDAAQLSEVIVTAQRRSEKLVDVPITVSTLSANQLAVADVVTLSDISKMTPALRFDSDGTFVQPSVRGIGTAITTSGGGPNVGIYVDGFFQSNPEVSDFQLLNIQSIQVLKGPQGTLFGRNTTGGAIVVTTADPSTTPGGEIKASYGSFNTRTLQGYATTGLNDKVAVDLQGIYRAGDGFQHQIVTGSHTVGEFDNWSIRAGLRAQVSDNVSVLLRYEHSDSNDPTLNLANSFVDHGSANFFSTVSPAGLAIYQAGYGVSSSLGLPLSNLNFSQFFPNLVATAPNDVSDNQTSFRNRSDTVEGTIKADLGFANLTSYTQFRTDNSLNYEDLDATGFNAFDILIGVKDTTFSQEFLLNSKPGPALQWTAGVNYYQNKDDWTNIQASLGGFNPTFTGPGFGPFGGSSTTTTSAAVFADATYEVLPGKFFVTLGGRYSHDLVSDAFFKTNVFTFSYEGPQGQPVFPSGPPGTPFPNGTVIPVANLPHDEFTPRLVLRYKPTDQSSVYASYTRGYKAGILNVGGDSQKPVNPENNDAYEVGYKFDNRQLSIDLAGYYYDYKNLQVSSFQAGAAEIRNAANAQVYGLEGQARYRFDRHFDVNAAVAWTHARYTSFSNSPYYGFCDPSVGNPTSPVFCSQGPGGIVETTVNAKGFQMQRAPEVTATLGANYRFDMFNGETTLSGNLYYTSKFYFDPSQQFAQNGYTLLGLHAQWVDPSRRYTITVFGDNVTGQRYQVQVIANTVGIGSVWSAPATWGVSVGAKF